MARKKVPYTQGEFTPTNPDKYVGTYPIMARSSWEFTVMRMADKHPSIIQWASEPVRIPYYNPIKRRQSVYIPDFLFIYEDRQGKRHAELIEVKPAHQSKLNENADLYTRAQVAVNAFKWDQARKWCDRNGLRFRVITQQDIFQNPKKR